MKIEVMKSSLESIKDELLVLGIFQDEKLPSEISALDKRISGLITDVINSKDFKAEFEKTSLIYTKNIKAKRILLYGLGKRKNYRLDHARCLASAGSRISKSLNKKSFSVYADNLKDKHSYEDLAQALTEGAILGNYDYTIFKTKDKKEIPAIESFSIITSNSNQAKQGSLIGEIVSNASCYVRNLVNTPSIIKVPEYLAKQAQDLAKHNKLKCKIFREKELKQHNMNALLAVGSGSSNPPRLVILEYGNPRNDTICMVGKGITFDSGGLNIKPFEGMKDMKEDMSGAAAVFGILEVVSKLKLPLHLIGIAALAENMPSGSAYRPGDIIKASNGKTIEVLNTDAEGRVVLADALSYANKFKPKAIIDLATLTGACVIALGDIAAGIMGTNERLITKLISAGEKSHERLWQLPLWQEYSEMIKSKVADIQNIGPEKGYAGAIEGAAFLKEFVDEKIPWAHIDIAGPAFTSKPGSYKTYGGTGFGVRLIVQFLRDWKK